MDPDRDEIYEFVTKPSFSDLPRYMIISTRKVQLFTKVEAQKDWTDMGCYKTSVGI